MIMSIDIQIPCKSKYTMTADEVILPGVDGQIGILSGHAPLVTVLDTGLMRVKLNEKWTPVILCGGLAEIKKDKIQVLANDICLLYTSDAADE